MPLKQHSLFDVATWEQDAEFGVFPQGARAKEAVFSPAIPPDPVITPNKRYLFKRSKRSYPDQFWGEIIAYRIGCLLNLEVPPAFVAWNSSTGHCAALIEWFYNDGEEVSVLAGDFLQQLYPDFDREKGRNHNLRHSVALLRLFSKAKLLRENSWRRWWAEALLFDSLIGNTDRHQDNWGFLFGAGRNNEPRARLMPLFDNGTSLGHERFVDRIADWQLHDYCRYVQKGTHHVSWSLERPQIKGHFELLAKVVEEWPETKPFLRNRISDVTMHELVDVVLDLVHLPAPVALSGPRLDFILRLLETRLGKLKALLL